MDEAKEAAWLMVGSAPSVLDTLPGFRDFGGTVITCNSGLKLWPRPDWYFVVDQTACRVFAPLFREARRHGTKLGTIWRSVPALTERGVYDFDEFVQCGLRGPDRHNYGPYTLTGLICLQFACMHGAKRIDLVGFDGYRSDADYFDAGDLPRYSQKDVFQRLTLGVMRPALDAIANAWDDIEFVQHGDPCFEVAAANWRVER